MMKILVALVEVRMLILSHNDNQRWSQMTKSDTQTHHKSLVT